MGNFKIRSLALVNGHSQRTRNNMKTFDSSTDDRSGIRFHHTIGPVPIRKWLSSLPTHDANKAMRSLGHSLDEVNEADIDADTRLAVLDLYHAPIEAAITAARNNNVSLVLPLSERRHLTIDSIADLHWQMMHGYSIVAFDEQLRSIANRTTRSYLAGACYWALVYAGEQMRCLYQGYRPLPKGMWRHVHRLYDDAQTLHLLDSEIGSSALNARGDSISDAYKRTLLLGLCGPYQLPIHAIERVNASLKPWARHVELTEIPEADRTECRFVIEHDSDQPGMPQLPRASLINRGHCLILDTTHLVVLLHQNLKTAMEQSVDDHPADASKQSISDDVDLLRALITQWGIHPIRKTPRKRCQQRCSFVVGFRTVAAVLRQIEMQSSGTNSNADVRHVLKGTFGYQQHMSQTADDTMYNVEAHNESATGIHLALDSQQNVQVRIGELVALRPNSHSQVITIGIVRWATNDAYNNLNIGIYKLGSKPQIVRIKSVTPNEHNIPDGYRDALILPESDLHPYPQTIVAEKGVYRPHGTIVMRIGGKKHFARVTSLITSTRSADWFEFRYETATLNSVIPSSARSDDGRPRTATEYH